MTTCHDCVRGPDETQDSIYCHEVGHRVYHDTRACRAFVPRDTPQQQSACRPAMLTNPLACAVCRSLFMCAGVCQDCGAVRL
jgi:hypothetical protein